MAVSRRAFLIGGAGVVGAGAAAGRASRWRRRRRVLDWAGQLADRPVARDLGVEYLTRHPTEDDRAALVTHVAPFADLLSIFRDEQAALKAFNEQLRRDFLDGDIVDMGGWLLARTEIRLCALAALEWSRPRGVRGVFARLPLVAGDSVFWSGPTARFTVPNGTTPLTFRLRSGTSEPQRVTVRFDSHIVDERTVWGREWQLIRYATRPSDSEMALELTTAPVWKPLNDFRTIGVGIDRIWDA